MDILAVTLIGITMLSQIACMCMILCVYNATSKLCELQKEKKPEPKPEEPAVTDPFSKPKPIFSSTSHIIVPKTPTEIRNQNFKKIQEGLEYGDIKRDEV